MNNILQNSNQSNEEEEHQDLLQTESASSRVNKAKSKYSTGVRESSRLKVILGFNKPSYKEKTKTEHASKADKNQSKDKGSV